MRIAQVAPLFESVPPRLYGGTERVVAYLTDELVRLGHDVTLFASADSVTNARLVPAATRSLRLDGRCRDSLAHHLTMLEAVGRRRRDFDVVHFHIDYLHFPWARALGLRHVTTLHGRLDLPDLPGLYREYAEMPLVSISDAQREPLSWANWRATVHHGLPRDPLRFCPRHGGYLAFLGRISPEKGVHDAIAIARRVGVPLRIAAKIDPIDRDYFEHRVRPLLDGEDVELVGEIGEHEKSDFLGNAMALLFPIDWPEPFGLVMIEALACGTPVIATRRGSTAEVVDDGVTGFLVDGVDGAVEAVGRVRTIDRAACRAAFEARFTAARMAADYVAVYDGLFASPDVPKAPAATELAR